MNKNSVANMSLMIVLIIDCLYCLVKVFSLSLALFNGSNDICNSTFCYEFSFFVSFFIILFYFLSFSMDYICLGLSVANYIKNKWFFLMMIIIFATIGFVIYCNITELDYIYLGTKVLIIIYSFILLITYKKKSGSSKKIDTQ